MGSDAGPLDRHPHDAAGAAHRLGRVSFVVLDEADRMFDMGCEPCGNFKWSLRGRVYRLEIVSEFRETGPLRERKVARWRAARRRLHADARRLPRSMSTRVRAPNRRGVKERAARSPDRFFSATFPRPWSSWRESSIPGGDRGGKSVASCRRPVRGSATGTNQIHASSPAPGCLVRAGLYLSVVDTQLKCDSIYEQLVKAGYPSLPTWERTR